MRARSWGFCSGSSGSWLRAVETTATKAQSPPSRTRLVRFGRARTVVLWATVFWSGSPPQAPLSLQGRGRGRGRVGEPSTSAIAPQRIKRAQERLRMMKLAFVFLAGLMLSSLAPASVGAPKGQPAAPPLPVVENVAAQPLAAQVR